MIAPIVLALALAAGDADAARRDLDALENRADAPRVDLVRGAARAMDALPQAEGNERAARLLDRALRMDPGKVKGTWSHVTRLYRRVREDGDADNGVPFLEDLIEIYPAQAPRYSRDLAYLLLDASRPYEAREAFNALLVLDPSDIDAAHAVANIDEMLGDTDAALDRYTTLMEDRGDVRAGIMRINLLWRVTGQFDEARALVHPLASLIDTVEEEQERVRLAEDLRLETSALEDAVRKRDGLRRLTTRQHTWLAVLAVAWIALLAGLGRWVNRAA
ncbi:MAG: tetratricopeptide repeat protein [Planctomycetota bacterium]|jgi:tetratricopeptide (TPR) repeat protein